MSTYLNHEEELKKYFEGKKIDNILKKNETQIIVSKDYNGKYWFTLQYRRVYFLFRGLWKYVYPLNQPTYDDAFDLIKKIK